MPRIDRLLAAVSCLCVLAVGLHGQDPARSLPNIVLILADDLGFGSLGANGQDAGGDTPVLDRLAAEGLRFTDLHTTAPICLPSRLGLFTGRYQQRSRAFWKRNEVGDQEVLADELAAGLGPTLRTAGYATGYFGKWGLGRRDEQSPLAQGFDEFVGYRGNAIDYRSHRTPRGRPDWWHGDELVSEDGYLTQLITRHAIGFIEHHVERADDQPFFLVVSHAAPHQPYMGPDDPARYLAGRRAPPEDRTVEEVEPVYREMVRQLDAGVGELIATLSDLELDDQTLVFFVSDNGANGFGSNAPWRGHKDDVFEGGQRVPALAWWPGRIDPGGVCDQLTSTLDLMPTLIDVAGGDVPRDLDGVSLLGTLTGTSGLGPRTLFWDHVTRGDEHQRAVRREAWKLMVRGERAALYDLAADSSETDDVSADEPQHLAELEAALADWEAELSSAGEPGSR